MPKQAFLHLRFLTAILVLLVFSCEDPDETPDYNAGDLISSEHKVTFTTAQVEYFMGQMGADLGVSIDFEVDAKSIVYITENNDGETVEVSGAIFVPRGEQSFPILSLQHGTAMKRTNVASVNPYNSVEGYIGIMTAGMGYITLVPDYPGFGVSEVIHPYVHGRSLANSVVDMIRANETFMADSIESNGQLFLTGYSEGGYATLATQKLMESDYPGEFDITAVAPMAGPYDVFNTARQILAQGSYDWASYAGFIFVAYNDVYGLDQADAVFQDPYPDMLPGLFDGSQDFNEINAQFPSTFADFIEPSFMTDFMDSTEEVFTPLMVENGLLDWTPEAPLTFFHGTADITVPYPIVESTVAALMAAGATDIELIPIPDGTHETAGVPAFAGMLAWFESLRE